MKLRDCNLNFSAVVKDSVIRGRPERAWIEARDGRTIPESLFRLYASADYLSFEKAPPFLNDEDRILFSYYGTLLNGLRDSLGESLELLDEVRSLEDRVWSPITGKGEGTASTIQRRKFRYLLLNLSCGLDIASEIVALLFTGKIPGLRPGRASFSNLIQWIRQPLHPPVATLADPRDHYLEQLHKDVGPLVNVGEDTGQDWCSLFLMYRNKLSHLGGSTLIDFRLHDDSGRFYAFLPREWPFTWQRHVSFSEQSDIDLTAGRTALLDTVTGSCMHIDLVEYSEGLVGRVRRVLDKALDALLVAYGGMRDFPSNTLALDALKKEARRFDFTDFDRRPS